MFIILKLLTDYFIMHYFAIKIIHHDHCIQAHFVFCGKIFTLVLHFPLTKQGKQYLKCAKDNNL